jgi:hypothetical protein
MARQSFHYIAIGLLVVYWPLAYFVSELELERFEKPFLFSTLLIILLSAFSHAAELSESRKDLTRIQEKLATVESTIGSFANDGKAKISYRDGRNRVYGATTSAILAATRRVWVTHLRNDGPLSGMAADLHFAACRQWAFQGEGRSFRRIILRGDNKRLKEFCRQELDFAAKAKVDHPDRYLVKILGGTKHLTEAFNVGLYDDIVIFTHRDGEETIALEIHSSEIATRMERYYDRLWNNLNAHFVDADDIA